MDGVQDYTEVASGSFDLNDEKNLPGQIVNINQSELEYSLVYTSETGIRINKRIKIPRGWEGCYVCLLIINYLNGTKYKSFSICWKKTLFDWFIDFFQYIESLDDKTDINTSVLVSHLYYENIKPRFSEKSVVRRIRALKSALSWNREEHVKSGNVRYWNDTARQVVQNIPVLTHAPDQPAQTTSQKLKSEMDDNDLFLSVRTYCAWFILERNKQRRLIFSEDKNLEHDILELVKYYGVRKLSLPIAEAELKEYIEKNERHSRLINRLPEKPTQEKINLMFPRKVRKYKEVKLEGVVFPSMASASHYYGAGQATVSGRLKRLNENYTQEQYDKCFVDRSHNIESFTGEDLFNIHQRVKAVILKIVERDESENALLEFACVSSEPFLSDVLYNIRAGKTPKFNRGEMLKRFRRKDFPLGFPFLELFAPSNSEACALSYLLATERIQQTGQDRLSIDDCLLDHKGVQFVGYEKPRSKDKSKISPHYSSKTQIYQVLEVWKKGVQAYHKFDRKSVRKGMYNFLTVGQARDKLKKFSKPSCLFYLPLLFNSLSSKQAIREEPNSKMYIDVMLGAYSVANIKIKNNEGKIWDQVIIRPTNRVGVKALAQTRGQLESKPISGLDSKANDLVDASMSAHTPETKKNTYKSRSASNSVLKSGFEFSKSVSDKMLEDAHSLTDLLESTELVTLKGLEIKLGYQGLLDKYSEGEKVNELLTQAEKQGYNIGAIGELNNVGKTVVICTPLVAALILGEIKHIEENIESVMNANPFKVGQYNTRKLFLNEIIGHFPKKAFKLGKKMLSEYNFPYPPLS